jgi:tetratricopeptide (TPR) repeat protein
MLARFSQFLFKMTKTNTRMGEDMSATQQLDGAELLHLGIEASSRNDHGAAIGYLKQALDLPEGSAAMSGDYAKYLYMLGAEYAQIGMMDRAQEYMSKALDMAPDLHTARFQLGLLHITCAQPAQALSVLAPLATLPEESAFHHFGAGLQFLIQDQLASCRESLKRGIELNSASSVPNLALNADMNKLLNALDENGDGTQTVVAMGGAPTAEAGYLMSAYSRSNGVN